MSNIIEYDRKKYMRYTPSMFLKLLDSIGLYGKYDDIMTKDLDIDPEVFLGDKKKKWKDLDIADYNEIEKVLVQDYNISRLSSLYYDVYMYQVTRMLKYTEDDHHFVLSYVTEDYDVCLEVDVWDVYDDNLVRLNMTSENVAITLDVFLHIINFFLYDMTEDMHLEFVYLYMEDTFLKYGYKVDSEMITDADNPAMWTFYNNVRKLKYIQRLKLFLLDMKATLDELKRTFDI